MSTFITQELENNISSKKDSLGEFIDKYILDENLKEDFFDLYLSKNNNDIIVNIEDLKFLNKDFIVDDIFMKSEELNSKDSVVAKCMKNIIEFDDKNTLCETSTILMFFKIHSNTAMVDIYEADDLVINLLDSASDFRDILFSLKYDDNVEKNYSKVVVLSVKEKKKDIKVVNNMDYFNKRKKLHDLNARIKTLQNKYLQEAVTLDKFLSKKVKNKNDNLDDYEIEIRVHFELREDDKEFDLDDDNFLTIINEHLKGISKDNLAEHHYYGTTNHNEHIRTKEYFEATDYNCWWFHCLYDHNNISFDDMLRIGSVWADIKVYFQYYDEIESPILISSAIF